jgi:site-specific DNA recombinase
MLMMMQSGSPSDKMAIYARTSKVGEERDEAGPIENQVSYGNDVYMSRHPGQIVEVYRDEGVSGATDPFKRPDCARMLADAKSGRFNVLLVYRLDRLARSLFYLLDAKKKLDEWDITIRSMTEPLDTSDPMGRFIFNLLGLIAEWERETIKERTELGRKMALAAGKVMGKPPAGYSKNEKGMLVVDPLEGPLVQEVFDLLAKGVTAGAIARLLNQRGTPRLWLSRGYSGKNGEVSPWRPGVITEIAHNNLYWTGQYRYERKNGSVTVAPAPPLVDHATAILACRHLSTNNSLAKGRANGTSNIYLLSGLIRCECGSAWSGSGSRDPGRTYYSCIVAKNKKRYAPEGRSCDMPHVRADKLDREVWGDIKAMAEHPGNLVEKIRAQLLGSAGDVDAAKRDLEAVCREYDELLAKRLDAQLRADAGEMTREELSAYLRAGVARVNELEHKKAELAESLALRQVDEARIASIESICRNLLEMVQESEGNPVLMRELVQCLVKHVSVTMGNGGTPTIHIQYLFSEPHVEDGSTQNVLTRS